MRTDRIETFSDGVFAIAITLLALEIHIPDFRRGGLLHELLKLWPSYFAYALSFLLIGLIWANHHAMFNHMARGDRLLIFINVLLLANVAFLPFPTAVLAESLRNKHDQPLAACFYGLTLTIGGIFFNAIWAYAAKGRRHLNETIRDEQATAIRRRFLLGPALYAAGATIALLSPAAALAIYASLILFFWLPGRADNTETRSSKNYSGT